VVNVPFCPNCGKEVEEEDEVCSHCGKQLRGSQPTPTVKPEKHEDGYGAIVGGMVVAWLGFLLLLQNMGFIGPEDMGGYFLLGIGAILILRGLLAHVEGEGAESTGYLAGGGVLALLGAGILFDLRDWWALILIAAGLFLVFKGVSERTRTPRPQT